MTALRPAQNLDEIWDIFDPSAVVDTNSDFYIQRSEDGLKKLTFNLKRNKRHFHGFLCGHVGSGKTTELRRLAEDDKINELYFPLLVSAQALLSDTVNLTHDALLVGMGLQLIKQATAEQLNPSFEKELNDWGIKLVKTFIHDESVAAEVGIKGLAWFAYFKANLKSRRDWKHQEKQILDPKVADLVGILNRMAIDFKNKTGKRLLVMVDDLEKGKSDAEKQMHTRLFSEYYSVLTQPTFNIVYTLPVYFKALPDKLIDSDAIYSFSAVRIYDPEHKSKLIPPLNKQCDGYLLMERFISQRLEPTKALFAAGVMDELIRIGGGLFRDTDAVVTNAAYYAIEREAEQITLDDVEKAFNKLKKDYQPFIRGAAIDILRQVSEREKGWVDGVEPFLQSKAVVEYQNGDVWLDIRYVLKAYLKSLLDAEKKPKPPSIVAL
ncbi:MAG: hypothetical protein ACI8WB_003291 [Phenylobacterium sp.]|jgi:hypothetical protein